MSDARCIQTAHLVDLASGDVVQLVRTLPCHGRGRGFESRRPRHSFQKVNEWSFHSTLPTIPPPAFAESSQIRIPRRLSLEGSKLVRLAVVRPLAENSPGLVPPRSNHELAHSLCQALGLK